MLFPHTDTQTGPTLSSLSPSLLSLVIKQRVVIRVSFGEVTFSPLSVFPFGVSGKMITLKQACDELVQFIPLNLYLKPI